MSNKNFRSFYFGFFLVNVVSMLFMLLSHKFIVMWLSMEINLYSVLPLLMNQQGQKSYYSGSSIMYFLFQVVGTVFFLCGLMIPKGSLLYKIGLLLKLGAFPMMFWFPIFMSNLSWPVLAMFLTSQKISMLFLMSCLNNKTTLFSFISMLTLMLLGCFGLYKSMGKMKSLLAWSSMIHSGFKIYIFSSSFSKGLIYFLFGVLKKLLIVMCFKNMGTSFSKTYSLNLLKTFWGFFCLMCLMGLPMFSGFIIKLSLLKSFFYSKKNMTLELMFFSVSLVFQIICYVRFVLNLKEYQTFYLSLTSPGVVHITMVTTLLISPFMWFFL